MKMQMSPDVLTPETVRGAAKEFVVTIQLESLCSLIAEQGNLQAM
jgi:hypothetical protein